MPTPLAKAYVDQLFAEKNLSEIYWAISVVEKSRELSEEFWLFSRIYEWAPARSGVCQYYESLPREQADRIAEALDRLELTDIADKYRLGQRIWDEPSQAAEVDRWLDDNADEIHDAVFQLIADKKGVSATVS